MTSITPINNVISIQKKAERIAAALFLVSNVIPDTEILKTKIRSISLDMVSLSVAVTDNTNSKRFTSVKLLEKNIVELISILDIASISGLISEMNSKIIKAEFNLLLTTITECFKSMYASEGSISADFFEKITNNVEDNIKDNYTHVPEISRISNVFNNGEKDEKLVSRKDQRGKLILSLISKRGTVSIKDISTSIKGCSEKTVQRELAVLIKEGLIDKIGERRWSKYSLRAS